MDIVDKKTRSRMMKGIGPKDTAPELLVRRFLHGKGFRYSLHPTSITGKPDIVLSKYGAAVFVHGCFWHRHAGCKYAYKPKTRHMFWNDKLSANALRDRKVRMALESQGWRVAVVWECVLRDGPDQLRTLSRLIRWIPSRSRRLEIP